ncbi:MAG: S-layer homology domain-containing protein [Bacillota bacterium]|nr:S-layer homology domain-containing protein [Bacillota bacterium]
MKQIIISVLSLAMMLSLSMGIAAQETEGGIISSEEAFAAMEAEFSTTEGETEEGASTLSAAKSGMDASISYDRVAVTSYKQVVDTYNNVPAYYEPVTSGSDFQCSEYITRYYKTVYGSNLKGFQVTTSPKPGDYIYATAAQRGKSYGHYAVIKSVNGSQLTLIEQNWAWRSDGTVYAAKNRVIPYGGNYAGTYTVYTPVLYNNSISYDAPGFSDLSNNHWAFDYITSLVNQSIIKGYSDGTFRPEASITRAEFMKILGGHAENNGHNVYNYTTQRFTDVNSSHWAYTYVNWGQQKGVVSGNGDGKFNPDAKITRQEMAVMLYNYATKVLGKSFSSANNAFSDKSAIESWAVSAVNAMVGAGIINGRENNVFAPTANATRAEAATMIYRLIA